MFPTCFSAKYPKYENNTTKLKSIDALMILYALKISVNESVQQEWDSIINFNRLIEKRTVFKTLKYLHQQYIYLRGCLRNAVSYMNENNPRLIKAFISKKKKKL